MVVFVAWAGGGRLPWAPAALLAAAVLGLPAVWLRAREDGGIRLRPFVPFALWCALLAIELMNPSHVANPHGGWWPRAGWISWLPTTVDRDFAIRAALPWLAALLEGGIIAAVRPSPRVGRFLWTVAALNGFALAAIGAAFHFAQADKMLGIIAVPERSYFFATFFYKNHWAAYGALCVTIGIVLALDAWERATSAPSGRWSKAARMRTARRRTAPAPAAAVRQTATHRSSRPRSLRVKIAVPTRHLFSPFNWQTLPLSDCWFFLCRCASPFAWIRRRVRRAIG